jgi:hypothetical protein
MMKIIEIKKKNIMKRIEIRYYNNKKNIKKKKSHVKYAVQ